MKGALVGASLFAATALSMPVHAEGDVQAACVDAHLTGQELRLAGRLLEARDAFAECARARCPALVTDQCIPWLADAEARLPSLVIDVRDPDGRDVSDATVHIDGRLAQSSIDGRAVDVNPGRHDVRVEAGGSVMTRVVVAKEGEKSRRLSFALSEGVGAPPAEEGAIVPVAVWVLGGVSVAAFAASAILFFDGQAEADDLRTSCAPMCTEDQVSAVRTELRAATIAFSIGAAATVGAGIVLLSGALGSGRASVAVRPNGAVLRATF